uniref:Uncharacterized protein n=1 Tax=Zea mays TaxID=4577 RepID=A0A804M094_MAIZE
MKSWTINMRHHLRRQLIISMEKAWILVLKAKALAEKNMRDILVQREHAEKHRLAEFLDPEVKRWSNGKEGNVRALLSTLQYIHRLSSLPLACTYAYSWGRAASCWTRIANMGKVVDCVTVFMNRDF